MPNPQQRRTISSFDARSVMLFAALTMGGSLAQAQTSTAPATQPKRGSPSVGVKTSPGSHAGSMKASLKRAP